MAGVPLFNGFLSKEMFFAETVFVSGNLVTRLGLPAMAVLWGTFSVAYSLRFILQVFFGPPAQDLPRDPHEPPMWMLLPSALLVTTCLVVGVFPAQTVQPYLDVAARSVDMVASSCNGLCVLNSLQGYTDSCNESSTVNSLHLGAPVYEIA